MSVPARSARTLYADSDSGLASMSPIVRDAYLQEARKADEKAEQSMDPATADIWRKRVAANYSDARCGRRPGWETRLASLVPIKKGGIALLQRSLVTRRSNG